MEVGRESQSEHDVLLRFSVRDTGPGVPPDKQLLIFDAFEQLDSSTTRRFGGTGLGLAISSRLAELMGGRIWLESVFGNGSTFHFTVLLGVADSLSARAPILHADALHDVSALVVDDNQTSRRILEEILRTFGMQPTLVASAQAALEALRAASRSGRPYRLLLTDVHMPEMDGFSLVETLRRDPELQSTPVIMLSSVDQSTESARGDLLGVAAYLLKPVKQSELLESIIQTLGFTAPAHDLAATAAARQDRLRPLRILLAEDSLFNQKLAVSLLEREGHEVVVAVNGAQALACWASQPL